ncbi:MAG: succinylglutamate desuccinylase/aspartoacylase family protein [Armatimonadota bacterium]|nr:succinylglutamate desuccinylase/aspartoacylase family protein [Armatimonadota bacterium]MDR7401882.1 succinylglutamate desuccinylase/aspartoacylase family protein [Armatimonadota bacterium]MDR7404933.1 succinylglutamate desuccinylase/aspartoacylase family protein [Armatimonadota bacterium]MDR7472067.1 succinylglutamate desuccinylase/aspartoacylase family protein [Armatimonadota bacterium]MDR7507162.1 succinylglutamate desuccinylase/aspartoacylase family protein [Armatimonadota bacterium]
MSRVAFAHLHPGRGGRAQGMVRIPGVEPDWEVPAVVIRGADDGPTLTITAGVHAAEYAGIAAAIRLGQELDPARLRGTLIIVSLINTPGFYERSMYVNPRDGKNINRIFPGDMAGSPSERVTHFLTNELIKGSDAYIDLHGGDMIESLIPFAIYQQTGNAGLDRSAETMAEAFDLDYVIAAPPDAVPGASYVAAARLGIPAIIAEVGQQGVLDRASVERHVRGVTNVMVRLGMLQGQLVLRASPRRLSRFLWVRAPVEGAFYPAVTTGQMVERSQIIGEVRDLFGDLLAVLEAPANGVVLFMVTALAVRKDDPLFGIGAEGDP